MLEFEVLERADFGVTMDFLVRLSVKVTCLNTLLEINTLCGSFMCEICYVEKYLRGVAGTQRSAEL